MPVLLEFERVSAGYGPLSVLKEVTLNVNEGEMVALIGANGAGKSTTLLCISRVVRETAGAIHFAGKNVSALAPHELVRRGVAHAPEGRRIFSRLTVAENLELGAYGRGDPAGIAQDTKTLYELFPALAARRRQAGGTLSGGEQQMLALARAYMARPRLMLLDEPSLGLAPLVAAQVFGALSAWRHAGMAILMVEQNARQALALAERAYVLESGRIALGGSAAKLVGDPRIQQAYLGS